MAQSASLFDSTMFASPSGSHIPGVGNYGANSPVLQEAPWTSIPLSGHGTGTVPFAANTGGVPGSGIIDPTGLAAPGGYGTMGYDPKLPNKLNHLFGGGLGATVLQALQTGGFDPKVAQAFIQAMMPAESRGMESIANEFGNVGLRNSSAAAIGMGDFQTQFAQQIMATLAGMKENATNRQYSILQNTIAPTGAQSKANEMSTWDMISAGLGLAGDVISGGALGGAGIFDMGDLFSKIPIPGIGKKP